MSDGGRISLAGLSRHSPKILRRASSSAVDTESAPTLDDLTEALSFAPGDGRIWLNDQRMMLLHASSFESLRRSLINSIGQHSAREMLTRTGFESGIRDGELVRRRWPDSDLANAFTAGPRLHSLEGVVKVTPVRFEFDLDEGSFYGEFLWHDSVEAEAHVTAFGTGTKSACWMEIGYASGYATAFLGRLIVYREIECRAMGHGHCRIIGKPAAEWTDADEDLQYFKTDHRPLSQEKRFSEAAADTAKFWHPSARLAPDARSDPMAMVGISAAFVSARTILERAAETRATALLIGESGVGKELFAQALHSLSPRSQGPFVAINCAAIPELLVEAELFGVEKGAYTGAEASRPGRFERANGGTLFLDEIVSLSMVAQGKLLRAIQEGVIDRVGSTRSVDVDVRIVAATNVELAEEVKARRFREDLYYRLNVCPIDIPPLRERRSDIPLLIEHFLARYCELHGRPAAHLTRSALEALLSYDYPGNIRELQNLIERGVIFSKPGEQIDTVHIFRPGDSIGGKTFAVGKHGGLIASANDPHVDGSPWEDIEGLLQSEFNLPAFESRLYEEAVKLSNGNISAAARRLGIRRGQLEYRIGRSRDGSGNGSS